MTAEPNLREIVQPDGSVLAMGFSPQLTRTREHTMTLYCFARAADGSCIQTFADRREHRGIIGGGTRTIRLRRLGLTFANTAAGNRKAGAWSLATNVARNRKGGR